jgi:hypothetical protein
MSPILYARVRDDYPLPVITAFGGREYTKHDWRPVPTHEEATARRMAVKSKDARAIVEIRDSLPETTAAPRPATPPAPVPSANANKSVHLVRKRQGEEVPAAAPTKTEEPQ